MSVPLEAFVLVGLIIIAGIYHFLRPEPDDGPLGRLIEAVTRGRCPKCEAVHPEAKFYTGSNNFWANFRCPECGYSCQAHVHQPPPDE